MAKCSGAGEGGQNKTEGGGREGDRTMHGLSVILCQKLPRVLSIKNVCRIYTESVSANKS